MGEIDFRLILVTDRKLLKEESLSFFLARCIIYGIKAVQIREKDLPDKELLQLARNICLNAITTHTCLLVNDRIDIALLTNANGIHVPENGVSINHIQKFSKGILTGKSVHSLKSANEAQKSGYDYIICGPVFETLSKKKYGKPLGLKTLEKVCKSVNVPVFAIGGITPRNVRKCLKAGAYGAGVIGSIFNAEDLKETIDDFRNAMGSL